MSPDEHQRVAQELESLIRDTQATIERAENHGLDQTSPEDFQALLDIVDSAVKQQREHTQAMLG
ncbi:MULTISPECIES: hypothetical protein [Halomonadaceae]|uniref:hypothetical protein n=1 Tax=Halomonadaceae TaxID=28256 RepID=UPI0018F02E41|nr:MULTISPECIES: hypothetical protein [Halomonas]MDR5887788.1 hypothetical protein [Halomonas janggokensis]QPL45641.1 hypothetical protein IT895_15960 [Halomonas sp. A40-4]